MQTTSYNFGFLEEHASLFVELAAGAERAFTTDPNTTLIKLRQLGEAMAQHIATLSDITFEQNTTQAELIGLLGRELRLDKSIKDLFHALRKQGNVANHQFRTDHRDALHGIQIARALAIWFHQTFGQNSSEFKPPAFKLPEDPSKELQALQTQIDELQTSLSQANIELGTNQQLNQLLAKQKAEFESLQQSMVQQAASLKEQEKASELELSRVHAEYEAKIAELQKQIKAESEEARQKNKQKLIQRSQQASLHLELTEAATRLIIDQQLIEAGWQANTEERTFNKGARPEKGVNQAIAEWPTKIIDEKGNVDNGRADYVLFMGLTPIAIVEAKKLNENVAGKVEQAERYSKGFTVDSSMKPLWSDPQSQYHIPFVYSCNGRPYVKQLAEQSGTWFRDVRHHSNLKKPLAQFHSPDGLKDLLARDKEKAEEVLSTEDFGYLKLRPYQEKAIRAVESTLAQDINQALLAMATGTGKTRTIIGLIYRFLKAERFKRILFLVDRTALGKQAHDDFKEAPLEQNQSLSKFYNINAMDESGVDASTRVQVATVQAMSKRIFTSDMPPPIDQFDCIIVDEAHRGYALDQDMTEGELSTRDAKQYLSTYRRVIDYFDAVKIGLTATPAKHTTDIFGPPVYIYSYREAVADDWLIDHEPPIRYETLLTQNGIKFVQGETVSAINTKTGEIVSAELEDDLDFEVESFNRRVISENFNRVICDELAKELDPFGEEKTMIFCATDLHADMVKRLLDDAFYNVYGTDYDQSAVAKITGKTDQWDKVLERYKNERYPSIAITVDLLTTGIDVPKICNLVFLRRVKSRILYEQMIGRATRRCDEIGKTVFRIYDPVDIYKTLEAVNTMKPVVKDPNIKLEQLINEVTDPNAFAKAKKAKGDIEGQTQADSLINQISQKIMRTLRKAEKVAEKKPEVKGQLELLHQTWGIEPKDLHQALTKMGADKAAEFLTKHQALVTQLEQVKVLMGSYYNPVISEHDDKLVNRIQEVVGFERPEDYLESFEDFIKNQINESAALSVVVNKPKDLTREQLKEVRLLLDSNGFSEANLQTAVRNQTNKEIAASIIGHIRRAAIGENLISFEERVKHAMDKIYPSQAWNPVQRKWLDRLAKQLVHEVILDRDFVNQRFADQGGAKKLNTLLNSQLDTILDEINESLWQSQA